MKKTITLILAFVSFAASAQTFINYNVTSFPLTAPGVYTGTTNFYVSSNVLAYMRAVQITPAVSDLNLTLANPGVPTIPANWIADQIYNTPILGPCTVTLNFTANSGANQGAVLLVEFNNVNANAAPGGTIVQPAGFTATIGLQTSTNLTTWTTITNASFPKTNANRFFRTSLSIP